MNRAATCHRHGSAREAGGWHPTASILPHMGGAMATNRAQRHLRAISDEHLDDTAIEMDCVEAAQQTYRLPRPTFDGREAA